MLLFLRSCLSRLNMHSQETISKVTTVNNDTRSNGTCSDINSINDDDWMDQCDHGPIFYIAYLLLKHLLLAILFLMIIFTLVRLPLIDDHLRHVILSDSLTSSTTSSPIDHSPPLQDDKEKENTSQNNHHQVQVNRFSPPPSATNVPLEGEEERLFQRIKVIVFLARLVVILVILVGIIGVIREDVTCLLIFVLMSTFRLITTLYVPYFHNGFISYAILFLITLMTFIFALLLMKKKKQLTSSTMNLDKSFPQEVIIESDNKSQFACQREYNCSSMRQLFNDMKMHHSLDRGDIKCKSNIVRQSDTDGITCIINDEILHHDKISSPIVNVNLHVVPDSPFSTLSTCSSTSFSTTSSSSNAITGRKSCIPSRIAAAMSQSLAHHSSTKDESAAKNVYK